MAEPRYRRTDLDPRLLEDPMAAQMPAMGLVDPGFVRGRFPAGAPAPGWQRPQMGWAQGPPQDLRAGGMTPMNVVEKRLGPAVVMPDRDEGGPPGALDAILNPQPRFRGRPEEWDDERRQMLLQFLSGGGFGPRLRSRGPNPAAARAGFAARAGGSPAGPVFRQRGPVPALSPQQRAVYRARPPVPTVARPAAAGVSGGVRAISPVARPAAPPRSVLSRGWGR